MASHYEALKVQNLINTYRANPDMFDDDQLDYLEQLAEQSEIKFKRMQGEFSLRRSLQQAQAGFIEGLITIDLIPKEPRTTGEAIFRQLGHLAGFAPGILKAPVVGMAKLAAKITGRDVKKQGYGRITGAFLDHVNVLDAVSVPMIASRGVKNLYTKGLKKSKLTSLDFLKQGAKTRAISEEALGLGSAMAVSNIWKGGDVIADSFVGGMVTGGVFGGIGNFVSMGNLYKGTPAQVDQANKLLRMGVASAFTGLPSTLRGEPTEMQIYEYLLGGFFGYNSRPAREIEAAKWFTPFRDPMDIFRPEKSKGFKSLSKSAQDFIINGHPAPGTMNSEGHNGSVGTSLRWLEQNLPEQSWRRNAEKDIKDQGNEPSEQLVQDYYREQAAFYYDAFFKKPIESASVQTEVKVNHEQLDRMDRVERKQFNLKSIVRKMRPNIDGFDNDMQLGSRIQDIANRAIERDTPNVESFIKNMTSAFGEKITKKHSKELRGYFHQNMTPFQEVIVAELGETSASLRYPSGEKISNKTLGERYHSLPINNLIEGADFQFMTHVIKDIDGKPTPVKIMGQELVKGQIEHNINDVELGLIQAALKKQNKYIVSGVKDKDFLLVANLKEGVTLENIISALSKSKDYSREEMESLYSKSLEKELEIFGDTPLTKELHERKFISNVLHLTEMNDLNMNNMHSLIDKDTYFGNSVADFNKRLQLLVNRMTPMVRESFSSIKDLKDGQLKFIIVEDEGMSSDTDGLWEFRNDVFDSSAESMGFDSKIVGHMKPVMAGKTPLGIIATKSNAQRATIPKDNFMHKNDIHGILRVSSAKLRGNNKLSKITYNKSEWSASEINSIRLPIENLQISAGTYENPNKDVYGTDIPLQLWGQVNQRQAKGFERDYEKYVLNPSLEGSDKGKELVSKFTKENKQLDVFKDKDGLAAFKELKNGIEDNSFNINELPLDFLINHLIKQPDGEVAKILRNKIMRLDKEGALDPTLEFDTDQAYGEFHETNRHLAEASRDMFVANHVLKFNKNNYFNALKKYIIKRFSNPYIGTAGKAWLKGYSEDMMAFAGIDPAKKTRKLKRGEIYLDEHFRQMPVVFRGKRITLGNLWEKYLKDHKSGLNKKGVQEYNEALNLLVIRTPADSMSGIRVLRLRGFTGQRGAGAFTHDKDNIYLGGADKDSDTIKLFQGIDPSIQKRYKKTMQERSHWFNKNGSKTEYAKWLRELFRKPNMSKEELDRFDNNKFMMFSPSYRFEIAKNASTAKDGLGYGLSGKIAMQNMYDYIESKGGTIHIGNMIIKLRNKSPYPNVNAHQFFRDLGVEIVNISADASKDPHIRPYNQFRDMLFKSLFEVTKKGKSISSYSQFTKETEGSILEAIKKSIDNTKPKQFDYETDKTVKLHKFLKDVGDVTKKLEEHNAILNVAQVINMKMGEHGIKQSEFMFNELLDVYGKLYKYYTDPKLGIAANKRGILEAYKESQINKYISKHIDMLTKEFSLSTPSKHREWFNSSNPNLGPDFSLDILGKEFGQFATIELLSNQFARIHAEFAKQGKQVNVIDDVMPGIKKFANKIKKSAQDIKSDTDGEISSEIDKNIYKMKLRLEEIERSHGIPDGTLKDYFYYWLLSPITSETKYNKKLNKEFPVTQYYKELHGSRQIPIYAKRNFYRAMDDIYYRNKDKDSASLDIKQVDIENNELIKDNKLFNKINDVIEERIDLIAMNSEDAKAIRDFKVLKAEHPMMEDFNVFFESFTLDEGRARDSTTIKMEDIYAINKFWDTVRDPKNIELGLSHYYKAIRQVDTELKMGGIYKKYLFGKHTPVLTSKGVVHRPVYKLVSPMGALAEYFKKSESGKTKFRTLAERDLSRINTILSDMGRKERVKYFDALYKYREEGVELKDLNVDQVIFNRLNNAMTDFYKKMGTKWIWTFDRNSNKYNWDLLLTDNPEYGSINKYMRYNGQGKFDIKRFEETVIDAQEQTNDIIGKVGTEGLLRYRYEQILESALELENPKNKKAFRENYRKANPFEPIGKRGNDDPNIINPETYMHKSYRNLPEGLLLKQVEYIERLKKTNPEEAAALQRMFQAENPFIDVNDIISLSSKEKSSEDLAGSGTKVNPLRERSKDFDFYKRTPDVINDYKDSLVEGYFKNLTKFKSQNEINWLIEKMKDYKPSVSEKAHFNKLYKNSDTPKELRYHNYLDAWVDYLRLYARDSMGHQSFFNERMMTPEGKEVMHLNRKNLYYTTSDEVIIKGLEKTWKSKLGKKAPFFNSKDIPDDPKARKEYFSRLIHKIGRAEAQYELMSLLANTGTWTTNIFGGATMTIGSAGMKNYRRAFSNKDVLNTLLTNEHGEPIVQLLDGTAVTSRKQLMTWLEERGVIDNFIQNEFEYNPELVSTLKKKGVNIKDFQRDILKAMKSKKGNRDENVSDVLRRYEIGQKMLKAGGFLMQQSERVNRLNAFIAHSMQAVTKFGAAGKYLTINDPFIFHMGEKGIEISQFLYQNAFRPAFMRTSMGKVLGRFKLFAFNSIHVRKEFYKQAKFYNFKEGTQAYDRFKDTFALDMLMFALGSAFMFSVFDTTLPPPYDWIQATADWAYGDKRERDMAFFGSPVGPLNILKPPVMRIPGAFAELINGDWHDFTGYTMYTLFPFGRGIRQVKQFAESPERAPEIFLRLPYNKLRSRLERAKKRGKQEEEIEDILG
jgi:hypothetical protein